MFNLNKTKLKEKKRFCSFSSMELSLIKQDCYTFLFWISSSETRWMEKTGQTALLPSRQGEVHQPSSERVEGAARKCLVDLRK